MNESWEYFNLDGATFRRPANKPGGVTHILNGKFWKPYNGNRTAPVLYGDRIMLKADEPTAEQHGADRVESVGVRSKEDGHSSA